MFHPKRFAKQLTIFAHLRASGSVSYKTQFIYFETCKQQGTTKNRYEPISLQKYVTRVCSVRLSVYISNICNFGFRVPTLKEAYAYRSESHEFLTNFLLEIIQFAQPQYLFQCDPQRRIVRLLAFG